jgi:hypothetical protein
MIPSKADQLYPSEYGPYIEARSHHRPHLTVARMRIHHTPITFRVHEAAAVSQRRLHPEKIPLKEMNKVLLLSSARRVEMEHVTGVVTIESMNSLESSAGADYERRYT